MKFVKIEQAGYNYHAGKLSVKFMLLLKNIIAAEIPNEIFIQ